MTHTEKKQMYNDIMKSVARTVNRRLNEAGVVSFEP